MALEPLSPTRFTPGRLIMTAGVDTLIHQGRLNPLPYLRRHLRADWGDLCDADRRRNDAAQVIPRSNATPSSARTQTRSIQNGKPTSRTVLVPR